MANKTSTFQDNNPPKADALWFNMVTTEIKNLVPIDGSTVDPNGTINDQAVNSIKSYVSQAGILCTDTGTANNYVLGASSPFANPMLKTGCRVRFKTANPNTGASNIVAFGGTSIACRKSDGITPLSANDIPSNIEVEFVYDGTYWVQVFSGNKATTTIRGISYLNNPITIANNATDANNDIDFSAGNALLNDGSGQLILLSAITKRLDASWSAGTNNGGLFSGTKANSTWYYAFAILNTSTGEVDAGFDSSSSGANVPSGWKISKLINCFKTSGAGNILTGTYFKDSSFYYTSQLLEESASNANNAGNLVLSFVPPIPAYAINSAYANNNTVNAYAYYTAGTSSTNIIWETSKLNAGFGRANGFIPTNNATIYRTYGRDAGQSSVCELYTCGFKLINS